MGQYGWCKARRGSLSGRRGSILLGIVSAQVEIQMAIADAMQVEGVQKIGCWVMVR